MGSSERGSLPNGRGSEKVRHETRKMRIDHALAHAAEHPDGGPSAADPPAGARSPSDDFPLDSEAYSWSVHPVRERRRAAAGAFAIIAGISLLTYLMMGSLLWPALSTLILVLSLNRFFWPSRFEINREGITAHYPFGVQHRKWSQVKRFAHDDVGGILSPFARSSRLDSWRALHVYFGAHRDEVDGRLRRCLEARAG